MSGQICPACGSKDTKEYKKDGERELRCMNCNYDSGDKYKPRRYQHDEREQERERVR
jgi:Zn ribbon nucleic-acid-binding protein